MSNTDSLNLLAKIIDLNEKLQAINADVAQYIINLQHSNCQTRVFSSQSTNRRRTKFSNKLVRKVQTTQDRELWKEKQYRHWNLKWIVVNYNIKTPFMWQNLAQWSLVTVLKAINFYVYKAIEKVNQKQTIKSTKFCIKINFNTKFTWFNNINTLSHSSSKLTLKIVLQVTQKIHRKTILVKTLAHLIFATYTK